MKPTQPSITTPVKSAPKFLVGVVAAIILTGSGVALWKFIPRGGSEKKPTVAEEAKPSQTQPAPLTLDEPVQAPHEVSALPVTPPPAGNNTPPGNQPETQPILAIPRNPEGLDGVPKGFGFADENPPAKEEVGFLELEQPTPKPTPEPPTLETQPAPAPPKDAGVETVDPRTVGLTANDGPKKEFEETSLTVQRTLTAISGEEKQLIRLKVPVMYQSRTLRLEGDTLKEAQRIRGELKTKAEELRKIKTDMEILLKNWNDLVEKTTPQTVLLPESPTLPQNQSASEINRKEDLDMTPGKAISFEVLDK